MRMNELQQAYSIAVKAAGDLTISREERHRYLSIADHIWRSCRTTSEAKALLPPDRRREECEPA